MREWSEHERLEIEAEQEMITRAELVMNLFEVGKKYEITTFIERDNGYFKCKCYVDDKPMGYLCITVFEPSNIGELLIDWTDVGTVKEIE
ncbi:hypothetical protein [Bacillus pseudomycoides]|uniref:hypothetical protein n=1 Tax=Bacillus pseudomycoides TaxID=64104 RepID=UPI000501330F|nr:hypothetical protein [Bacillus pseudomycoides]KFN13743.1 hypothetical protein DJ94_4500 [Bacillus pseudomycoides]MDR4188014.1 hypothetical protein [Bacillus pseudomycoides]MED0856367.1 hypothetical protein [Bacillus pseudomycoides]